LAPQDELACASDTECPDDDFCVRGACVKTTTTTTTTTAYVPPSGYLRIHYNSKCMDYNTGNGNVYMHDCHSGSNQKWYLTQWGHIKSYYDHRCLDYHTGNGNVYVGNCHSGSNQKWYFNEQSQLKTHHNGNCADMSLSWGAGSNVYMGGCHGGSNQKFYFSNSRRLDVEEVAAPLEAAVEAAVEAEPRRLEDESPECMMCVSGVAPELASCNPGNPARYLGHAECCGVWDSALTKCEDHCTLSTRSRKLSTCSKLEIGNKNLATCDACLEQRAPGSSTGSDCGVWKQLLPQCEGPCEQKHRNYDCKAEESVAVTAQAATPETCRRCVMARSPEVADCLADASMDGCCTRWQGWLDSCAAECPAPAAAKDCDLAAVVEQNLVEARSGWPQAAVCEECVQRQGGGPCLASPDQACCATWTKDWASACQFQCGAEGQQHVAGLLCGEEGGADFSAAFTLPILAYLLA
jgi:hypothetical protein